jgi:hypothetical protein
MITETVANHFARMGIREIYEDAELQGARRSSLPKGSKPSASGPITSGFGAATTIKQALGLV